MSCERFKTRLLDFALGAEDAEFSAHLDACAACRAALDAQRTLLASMDRGLASLVAGEPAGDFAEHVRQRIAQAGVTTRPWFAGWLPVSAAALALVVLVGVLTIGRPSRPPQSAGVTPPAQVAPIEKAGAVAPPEVTPTKPPRTVAIGRPPRPPQSAAVREPEVLVPRGQMDAVMQLYHSVWSGKADGAMLMAEAASMEELLKPLKTPELRIAPLEIERLSEEGKPIGSSEKR
jgi:hypothetical protein